jgi:hypothetical protein
MELSDCYLSQNEIESKIPDEWSVEDEEYEGRIKFEWVGTGNHIIIQDWGEEGYLFAPMIEANSKGFTAKSDSANQTTFATLEGAIKQSIHLINDWDEQYS